MVILYIMKICIIFNGNFFENFITYLHPWAVKINEDVLYLINIYLSGKYPINRHTICVGLYRLH